MRLAVVTTDCPHSGVFCHHDHPAQGPGERADAAGEAPVAELESGTPAVAPVEAAEATTEHTHGQTAHDEHHDDEHARENAAHADDARGEAPAETTLHEFRERFRAPRRKLRVPTHRVFELGPMRLHRERHRAEMERQARTLRDQLADQEAPKS